jgi:hypothetical protein
MTTNLADINGQEFEVGQKIKIYHWPYETPDYKYGRIHSLNHDAEIIDGTLVDSSNAPTLELWDGRIKQADLEFNEIEIV